MSELTIMLLRVAFVAALWLFVIITLTALRRDLVGTTVVDRSKKSTNARKMVSPAASAPAPTPVRPGVRQTPSPASNQPKLVTTLVVTAGPLKGTSLHLHSMPILIGRAPECTLVLDDDYASSRHARVFQKDSEWFVEDLGSTNGTLLAGRKIESTVPFKPGATLRIGRTEIELRRGPK